MKNRWQLDGLELGENTRIDLDEVPAKFKERFARMILLPGANDLMVDYQSWLARAARARNIAGLLAPNDAEIVDAYARECEIEARRLIDSQAWHPKAT